MKARKQKVVSISDEGLIGIRIMAARLGVSTRVVVDMILDTVGMDSDLQERILECQENDLERKENQNGTSGKSISTHRKMNPTDRNIILDHRKMTSEDTAEESVPEEVETKEEEAMLKSYKTKATLPNSGAMKGNDNGVDASPVPLLTEVEGIKGVPSGGYVVRGDKLYMSYANKMYETQIGDQNKIVHLEIDGKKIKIDTAKKLGSI
jgi:hypothetical protein